MNEAPAWVKAAQTAASQNKKVLAVEGKNDVAVYREWLHKRLGPAWVNAVHLENARDRARLLSGLRRLNEADDPFKDSIFGLADRDEWQAADVAALKAELPTLLVNESRHSLESYFCDPDELEAALTASGNQNIVPVMPNLRQRLESALEQYVPHWALGCTIQRANERIREDAQYPAFFRDICPLPADEDIAAKLQQWASMLDPTPLLQSYASLRQTSFARPQTEQFRSCVEPKLLFAKVVVAGPDGLNSVAQKSAEDWRIQLARWSPAMPADLEAVLAPLLV